jgi:hypothetical protein
MIRSPAYRIPSIASHLTILTQKVLVTCRHHNPLLTGAHNKTFYYPTYKLNIEEKEGDKGKAKRRRLQQLQTAWQHSGHCDLMPPMRNGEEISIAGSKRVASKTVTVL